MYTESKRDEWFRSIVHSTHYIAPKQPERANDIISVTDCKTYRQCNDCYDMQRNGSSFDHFVSALLEYCFE